MSQQTQKYMEQSELSRELTQNLDTDGDGKVDNVKDEKRFYAVVASLKSIKFDLAKRDAEIAKIECNKKELELRQARIQVTSQGKVQGNWASHLTDKLSDLPTEQLNKMKTMNLEKKETLAQTDDSLNDQRSALSKLAEQKRKTDALLADAGAYQA